MVIFGILLQEEIEIDKIPKKDFIIKVPPLFFASEVKNTKKVTLLKNAKKDFDVCGATIFVYKFYLDWYLV